MILIGDFNSNNFWNKKLGLHNHATIVNAMKDCGLNSAYHHVCDEEQGEETSDTFFTFRHDDKGYHINYAFLNQSNIKDFSILTDLHWLTLSDHMPLVLETRK